MIDFACKQFDMDQIVKCALGLTKSDQIILQYFLNNPLVEITTQDLSDSTSLNLTTIQKAVKKLYEKEILLRKQQNLDVGGYVYVYSLESKTHIRNVLKAIIQNWSSKVAERIDKW